LKNPITKNWLVEWLKVKALSSSPSTTKTKTKQIKDAGCSGGLAAGGNPQGAPDKLKHQ
jgi:hypothetical protein